MNNFFFQLKKQTLVNLALIISLILLLAIVFVLRNRTFTTKSKAATANTIDLIFNGSDNYVAGSTYEMKIYYQNNYTDVINVGSAIINFAYPTNILSNPTITYNNSYFAASFSLSSTAPSGQIGLRADAQRNIDGTIIANSVNGTAPVLLATVTFTVTDSPATDGTFSIKYAEMTGIDSNNNVSNLAFNTPDSKTITLINEISTPTTSVLTDTPVPTITTPVISATPFPTGTLLNSGTYSSLTILSYNELITKETTPPKSGSNVSENVLKQNVLLSDGKTLVYRYGYWDSVSKTYNFTTWGNSYYGGDLSSLVGCNGDMQGTESGPGNCGSQTFRSYSQSMVLALNPYNNGSLEKAIKTKVINTNGTTVYYRYEYWDSSTNQWSNKSNWTTQYGDLSNEVGCDDRDPGVTISSDSASAGTCGSQTFISHSEIILPAYNPLTNAKDTTNALQQVLLTGDGTTTYWRYGFWDASATAYSTFSNTKYTPWTLWHDRSSATGTTWGNLNNIGTGNFLSFDEAIINFNRNGNVDSSTLRQNALSEDGKTLYYRYGFWNNSIDYYDLNYYLDDDSATQSANLSKYTDWSSWTTRDLSAELGTSGNSSGTGNASFTFIVRLQGIGTDSGVNSSPNDTTLPVSVKLVTREGTLIQSSTVNITYSSSTGYWTSDSVSASAGNYRLIIKGPKHVARRYCENNPTVSAENAAYSCGDKHFTLSTGSNTLSFVNLPLLSGDLPLPQDGVLNAADAAQLISCINNTSDSCLTYADLNYDGVVDAHDNSLMIASMKLKYDDEQ